MDNNEPEFCPYCGDKLEEGCCDHCEDAYEEEVKEAA